MNQSGLPLRTQKQREEGEERDAANHSGRGKSIIDMIVSSEHGSWLRLRRSSSSGAQLENLKYSTCSGTAINCEMGNSIMIDI